MQVSNRPKSMSKDALLNQKSIPPDAPSQNVLIFL